MARARNAPEPVQKGKRERGHLPDDLAQEVTGVALAAAGVWSLFALATGGGWLGNNLKIGLMGLFGVPGAWVAPLLTLVLGGYLVYLRRGFQMNWRLLGWLLLFLVLMGTSQVLHQTDSTPRPYNDALDSHAGGLFGWGLIYLISLVLGGAGRYIVLIALAWVGFMMATHISVADQLRFLVRLGMQFSKRLRASRAQRRAERLVQRQAQRAAAAVQAEAVAAERTAARERAVAKAEPHVQPERLLSQEGNRVADWVLTDAPEEAPPRATRGAGGRSIKPGETAPAAATVAAPTAPPAMSPAAASAGAGTAPLELPLAPAVASPAGGRERTAVGVVAPATEQGTARKGQEEATRQESEVVIHRPAPPPPAPPPEEAPSPRIVVAEPTRSAKEKSVPSEQLSLTEQLGRPYQLPSLSLLPMSQEGAGDSAESIRERIGLLEHTLETFGVKARVTEVHVGPAITRFELQPAPGVRVNKITALADDLALNLAAEDVRIQAPIPGKGVIGIEVPNRERAAVLLRDVLESPEYRTGASRLTVGLGKDIAGKPVIGDLGKMPHVLIAGATGSGKSVCMNTLICSILFKARPDEVKVLMIDPKRVELAVYEGIPHLAAPVVTDPRKAAGFLKWAVKEMEVRYDLFASSGVRDITRYNQLVLEDPGPDPDNPRKPLPYIVIFIDELADLMMVAPGDVEDAICRLAQMARACGMHLVVATQRPSVDVITGLIKANIPSRIAFAVSSQVDSRTILDGVGAEKLLGRGDMLYNPIGASHALRAQGAFISEREVEKVVSFVKKQAEPQFHAEPMEVESVGKGAEKDDDMDPVFPEAVRVIIEHGQASVSILQRRLRLNYTKAARLIDDMEQAGFIGPHQGPKPREVLISMGQWEHRFGSGAAVAEPAAAMEED